MKRAINPVRSARRRRAVVLGLVLTFVAGAGAVRTAFRGPAAAAESRAVWLYLDAAAARTSAPPALSAAALERRVAAGIPILDGDRPLPAALLERIARTGAELRVESRWLRAVSVDATPAQLRAVRRLPFVRRIAPVGRLAVAGAPTHAPIPVRSSPARPWTALPAAAENDSAFYGINYRHMTALGIPLVHELGLTGQGINVAILDTGFERQHESLSQRILGAQYDFINGDANTANEPGDPMTSDQERHGTWVWSLLGGFAPGLIVGPAYNATFFLAKVDVEPGDTRADEDRWVAAAEWADSLGARIISSSVYFRSDFTDRPPIDFQQLNGDLTATTVAADEAARRGILVVQAIGNAPRADGSLAAPADADSILAVGAIEFSGEPVDLGVLSSARGPTADGRTKPEVVAVGANVAAASSITLVGLNYGLGGTSFTTPMIAGAAALFMEAWPGLNPMAVRRALQLAGNNAHNPDQLVGWGLPNLGAAIMLPDGLETGSITPRDLNGNPASLAPVFSWNAPLIYPGLRPLTFRLELATDSLFQQVVSADTVHDAFSLALRSPLRPGLVLWWRVTAASPNGITRRSNVGGPITAPHWVTLLTLAGDQPSQTETTRPVLSWSALPAPAPNGPLVFDVEVLAHATGQVLQRLTNINTTTVTVPSPLTPNAAYRWRVITRTPRGQVDTVTSVPPFVVNSSDAPPATLLYQNFPNPFPQLDLGMVNTRIWFDLSVIATVELSVHDLRGRLVRSLIPAQPSCSIVRLPPGVYGRPGSPTGDDQCVLTTWDGRDQRGERVPRGVYVLRLLTNGRPDYRRMLYQPN